MKKLHKAPWICGHCDVEQPSRCEVRGRCAVTREPLCSVCFSEACGIGRCVVRQRIRALAKVEGPSEIHEFWVVEDPRPESVIGDCCYPSTPERFARMIKGAGLWDLGLRFYLRKSDAIDDAARRMKARDTAKAKKAAERPSTIDVNGETLHWSSAARGYVLVGES